ncbi:MAG: hypothetical protein ACLU5J_12095 [Christensenellales bacterium]
MGVGKLGSALLGYRGFERYGIHIIAGFDLKDKMEENESLVKEFTEKNVLEVFENNLIDIGIICVPKNLLKKYVIF